MKTKLEMAHEWAIKHGNAETVGSRQNMIKYAWDYADTMQAEADKRSKAEAEQKRKAVREMLNDANTFVEREGQHFDDVADIQKPHTRSEEWQPDWSQAPKHMNYFFMNKSGSKYWAVNEPDKPNLTEHVMNFTDCGGDCYAYASLQDYQGDWRNSLRKRPQ